jgi:transcriptional regulator with PAS, ATPase and Fis domain
MSHDHFSARLHHVFPRHLAKIIPLETSEALADLVELRFINGQHVISDLGSATGTYVDGTAIGCRLVPLHDQAIIRVDESIYVYEAARPIDRYVEPSDQLPGASLVMHELRGKLDRIARSDAPVLIEGETGAGKERVARELHRLSGRSGPFIAVNCVELGGPLFTSSLFGHRRGAFTGADEAREGLLRAANGGTFLFDEIGELDIHLQAKLLRVIEERQVRPLGDVEASPIDVRFLSATHRDLPAAIEQGTFRRDLYARLAILDVRVPSLAERKTDLLDWITRLGSSLSFDARAVETLLLFPLQGNLRDLLRVARYFECHGKPNITTPELRALFRLNPGPRIVSSAEIKPKAPNSEELGRLLEQHGGSVRAVAKHLRRDRRQIYRWMDAFELRR